jgi:hypothetical protein
MNPIAESDLVLIAEAKRVLEGDSIATRLSRIAGAQIGSLVKRLPEAAQQAIGKSVHGSLVKATEWAFLTTGSKRNPILRSDWVHHGAVIVSGGLGGSLGLVSTLWELPVSTMLMLRSIGCIAEEEGMAMEEQKTRLACVTILAMGANARKIEGDELGYWVVRKVMASFVTELMEWGGKGTAPVLARFIISMAARYGLVVSEKVAAQLAPLVGAATGASINHIFLTHFQRVAHAHFGIERLCLRYGETAVKDAYGRAGNE